MKITIVDDPKLVFVTMTRDEAIRTIESLSHQLYTGDPNGCRYEHRDEDGVEFSIAVMEKNGKWYDPTRRQRKDSKEAARSKLT